MTMMTFTLWGKRFHQSTTEVREEAARLLQQAEEAENAETVVRELFSDGMVTKEDIRAALAAIRKGNMRQVNYDSAQLWSWFRYEWIGRRGKLKLVCQRCGHMTVNPRCLCYSGIREVGDEDELAFRVDDLLKLREQLLADDDTKPPSVRYALGPLFEALEQYAQKV